MAFNGGMDPRINRHSILIASASLLVLGLASQASAQTQAPMADQPPPPVEGARPPPPPEPPTPPPFDDSVAAPKCAPPQDHPPVARPGQCFARVLVPAQFETYQERVEVAPPRHEVHVTAAVFQWDERQEVVIPEHLERHVIPPTYREITETVVVRPASVREDYVPPVFGTQMRQVVVRPAHTEWRRRLVGPDGPLPADTATDSDLDARAEATGEIVCLVEVPAEVETVPQTVQIQPGHTVEVPIPAETRQITREVVDQPEHEVDTVVPAVYRTVRYRRLVTPERTDVIDTPPLFETRERRRLVVPVHREWRLITCAPHAAPQPPPRDDGERG